MIPTDDHESQYGRASDESKVSIVLADEESWLMKVWYAF